MEDLINLLVGEIVWEQRIPYLRRYEERAEVDRGAFERCGHGGIVILFGDRHVFLGLDSLFG